jgi:hypothetical protein
VADSSPRSGRRRLRSARCDFFCINAAKLQFALVYPNAQRRQDDQSSRSSMVSIKQPLTAAMPTTSRTRAPASLCSSCSFTNASAVLSPTASFDAPRSPMSKIEAAYHKADRSIEQVIQLLAQHAGKSNCRGSLMRIANNVTRSPTAPICERGAALISHLEFFETELLTQADNRFRKLPPLTADIGGWYWLRQQYD